MTSDPRFENCLQRHGLVRTREPATDLIAKERKAASQDLQRAQSDYQDQDWKWTIIKSYYAMFHAAKALVLTRGYREKSHECLGIALDNLWTRTGELATPIAQTLRHAKALREAADYDLDFDQPTAKQTLDWASTFIQEAQRLLDEEKP